MKYTPPPGQLIFVYLPGMNKLLGREMGELTAKPFTAASVEYNVHHYDNSITLAVDLIH